MYLSELLVEGVLNHNDLDGKLYGEEGQLQVVGWSGKSGWSKYYIVKCNKCCLDSELFGDGYFRSLKGDLVNGHLPCGCGRSLWNKDQYFVLCKRKASEIGYTFLDFYGEWVGGRKTKIRMLCNKHGEWNTGSVSYLLSGGRGCPSCKIDKLRELSIKSDDVMIASFFDSGCFHPETKFWRSDRTTKQGFSVYWNVFCPECNMHGEAVSNALQRGDRPCGCSNHRQKEAYVNLVKDNGLAIAVKFGISVKSQRRLAQQNYKSIYDVEKYCEYTFSDVASCKRAERECKQGLKCGVLSKQEMPDGYTETTYLHNLSRIIEIYEENGGVLINQNINKEHFEFSNNQEVTK